MALVEDASIEHFEALYERLLRPLNDDVSRSTWRRLFEQPWNRTDALQGKVLIDDGVPVGYAGFIHGWLPRADGSTEHLCNVTTWVVDPEYSSRAPALIAPVLAMKDTTITNLTNIPSVHEMFTRLGFVELESSLTFLRPVLRRSGWPVRKVLHGLDEVMPHLPDFEKTIARDHAELGEHCLLVGDQGEQCYLLFTRGRRHRIPLARLHWATPGMLGAASVAIRRVLMRRAGAALVEIDSRLAPPDMPGSFTLKLPVPRVYRSQLPPGDVPNVYSELLLLEL